MILLSQYAIPIIKTLLFSMLHVQEVHFRWWRHENMLQE